MCAIFGFLDYGKKVSASTLKRLFRALSVAAESRGTDATGISYGDNSYSSREIFLILEKVMVLPSLLT